MGTTTKTTGSNQSQLQFNPAAQSQYNALVTGGGNQLQQMINNPFGNALYQLGLGQSQRGAAQLGQNNLGMLNQNQLAQGLGGQAGQGWLAAQRAMTGRANTSMMSQANIGNVMQALNRQMAATGMGMSFSPQLTGQTGNFQQTQSTGGLGTWLPQVAGMALGGLTGGLTGGLGMMGGGGGGGGAAGMVPGLPMATSGFSGFPSSVAQSSPMMPNFGMGMMNPMQGFGIGSTQYGG